jgi:uncharacterized membrane protein
MNKHCLVLGLCIKDCLNCIDSSLHSCCKTMNDIIGAIVLIFAIVLMFCFAAFGIWLLFGVIGHSFVVFLINVSTGTSYVSFDINSFNNDGEFYFVLFFFSPLMGFALCVVLFFIVSLFFFSGLCCKDYYNQKLKDANKIVEETNKKKEKVQLELQKKMEGTSFGPEPSSLDLV